MGVRFDHASSILICAEESTTILDFDVDDDNRELGFHGKAKERVKELIFEQRCDFHGDSVMGLELQSEESLRVMIERESEFLPRRDYSKRLMDGDLDISIRRDAIDWIGKCLSPFEQVTGREIFRCGMLTRPYGTSLLEYRPSEIAAAVALVSLRETQVVEIDEALTSCIYVEKERVMKCIEVIQEIALMKRNPLKDPSNPSSSSLPQSPIGVLDAASLSYGRDISTVGSQLYFQNCSPVSI